VSLGAGSAKRVSRSFPGSSALEVPISGDGRQAALIFPRILLADDGAKLSLMKATIAEVEKHPSQYLNRVLEGETVVLVRNDLPVAEIRPLNASLGPRPIGLGAGDFVVPDDFDAPLPDDLLDAFEGK
jgi:antitoxin (DNA-binding transcriptional repressor) of toxin-antitoxin stability system